MLGIIVLGVLAGTARSSSRQGGLVRTSDESRHLADCRLGAVDRGLVSGKSRIAFEAEQLPTAASRQRRKGQVL